MDFDSSKTYKPPSHQQLESAAWLNSPRAATRKAPSGRRSPNEWERMKPVIEKYWLTENKPLSEVQRILVEEHDFDPSIDQLSYRIRVIWKLGKYITAKNEHLVWPFQGDVLHESSSSKSPQLPKQLTLAQLQRRWNDAQKRELSAFTSTTSGNIVPADSVTNTLEASLLQDDNYRQHEHSTANWPQYESLIERNALTEPAWDFLENLYHREFLDDNLSAFETTLESPLTKLLQSLINDEETIDDLIYKEQRSLEQASGRRDEWKYILKTDPVEGGSTREYCSLCSIDHCCVSEKDHHDHDIPDARRCLSEIARLVHDYEVSGLQYPAMVCVKFLEQELWGEVNHLLAIGTVGFHSMQHKSLADRHQMLHLLGCSLAMGNVDPQAIIQLLEETMGQGSSSLSETEPFEYVTQPFSDTTERLEVLLRRRAVSMLKIAQWLLRQTQEESARRGGTAVAVTDWGVKQDGYERSIRFLLAGTVLTHENNMNEVSKTCTRPERKAPARFTIWQVVCQTISVFPDRVYVRWKEAGVSHGEGVARHMGAPNVQGRAIREFLTTESPSVGYQNTRPDDRLRIAEQAVTDLEKALQLVDSSSSSSSASSLPSSPGLPDA